MTITDVPVDRLDALEAKLDRLTDQITFLTAEAEHRRRQREAFDDFTGDLSRVSEDAMAMATRELESLSRTADLGDTLRLLRRLLEVAPTLERALVASSAVAELVDDAAPLGNDVMTFLTERLEEADRRGYFGFANAAFGVSGDREEDARLIVDTFDKPENRGKGVIRIDGRIVELLHLEQAKNTLEKVRAQRARSKGNP